MVLVQFQTAEVLELAETRGYSLRQNQNWERSDQPDTQLAQTCRKCALNL